MCAKDPYEAKYQFLTNKRQSIGLKHFNGPRAVYERCLQNVNENNPGKKCKILIVFDDTIIDMINNKK